MATMWLIGANLIREQRWLALLLALYVVVMSAVIAGGGERVSAGDVGFLLKQQAIYAVLFGALLALSALHNERKSRRILAVLSKSVTRAQYIAGLLLGVMSLIGGYCVLVFLAGVFVAWRIDVGIAQIGMMTLAAVVAALLAATVALFFTSMLPPIVATAATGLAFALPVLLQPVAGARAQLILPVYSISLMITQSSFDLEWAVISPLLAAGVVEALVVWLLAVGVFSFRDIAVAVE
jgi:ABC-type transport system involved in multi-copper enzyme maturation permease subunit